MKAKQRFGMGGSALTTKKCKKAKRRRRRSSKKGKRLQKAAFGSAIRRPIRTELPRAGGRKFVEENLTNASKIAVAVARKFVKSSGGKRKIRTPR